MLDQNLALDRKWEIMALVYLGLPSFLFLWGWTRWLPALIASAALFGAMIRYAQGLGGKTDGPVYNLRQWLGMGLLFLPLLYFSGLSHHFPQSLDYIKHHELWQELVNKDWPVVYPNLQGTPFLDYYLAYYLPPTWLAKIFHTSYLLPTAIWGAFGLGLCLYGFSRLFAFKPILSLLLLLLISGQDLLWIWAIDINAFLQTGHYQPLPWGEMVVAPTSYLSIMYKGPFAQLFWAPQHALGGWLACLLVLRRLRHQPGQWKTALPILLSFFWSPFVTLGLMPLAGLDVWQRRSINVQKFIDLAFLLPLGLVLLIYYGAHDAVEYLGFVWQITIEGRWPIFIAIFLLVELGFYAILMWGSTQVRPLESFDRLIYQTALISLLLIPFFHMGRANDFVMRASIPLSLIFYASLIRQIPHAWKNRWLRLGFVATLGLGVVLPFAEAYKMADYPMNGTVIQNFPKEELQVPQMNEIYEQVGISHDSELGIQYLGKSESFFFQYLIKKPSSNEP